MKFNKIYSLGLSLLLGSTLSLSAQKEDKNIYNMERLKADNPWISSYNAAGLTFNRFSDFSLAEIGFQYDKGDFRNVIDPTSAFGTKILAKQIVVERTRSLRDPVLSCRLRTGTPDSRILYSGRGSGNHVWRTLGCRRIRSLSSSFQLQEKRRAQHQHVHGI